MFNNIVSITIYTYNSLDRHMGVVALRLIGDLMRA